MFANRICGTLVLGIFLIANSGCASRPTVTELAEFGPTGLSLPLPKDPTMGTLVVYTGRAPFRGDPSAPERVRYSDYEIRTAEGTLLQTVKNGSDTVWEGPAIVSLPAGKYRITARAVNIGQITAPVRIDENHCTTVHLDPPQ
jgi:hypothetical protein